MNEQKLRKLIREALLLEQDESATQISVDKEESDLGSPASIGKISWAEVLPNAQGEDREKIQAVIDAGPDSTNANGEYAIIAALKIVAPGNWSQVGGGKDHDIYLDGTAASLNGVALQPGKYEAKTQAPEGGKIARLGQAKAVEVAMSPPLDALKKVGEAYRKSIVRKYSDEKGAINEKTLKFIGNPQKNMLGRALRTMIEFFETPFSGSGKKRYENMMGLELAAGTVENIRGPFLPGLEEIANLLKTVVMMSPEEEARQERGRGDTVGGVPNLVTVTSDEGTPTDTDDDTEFKFDTITWAADVSRRMSARQAGSGVPTESDKAELDEEIQFVNNVVDALKDVWQAIDSGMGELQKLSTDEFWDDLAKNTQVIGDDYVRGLWTVDKVKKEKGFTSTGFSFWVFPDLTTVSITQGGRLVLKPKNTATNESIERDIRLLIREALLLEELTKTDKAEIKRIAKKQAKSVLDSELDKALGTSFFGNKGKVNKFVDDEINRRFKAGDKDKDFSDAVEKVAKRVLQALYTMHYKRNNLIKTMPVPKS